MASPTISAPMMLSPYSLSLSPTRATTRPLLSTATIVSMPPLDRSGMSVRKRSWIVRWMTLYSPDPRDAASSDSEMMASRPSLDTWSIHLWASTLNICSAAYCARSSRWPSAARSFCSKGCGAMIISVAATAETSAIRMNQILEKNMRRSLALFGSRLVFFFVRGRDLDGQLVLATAVDLLLGDPLAARPDLQRRGCRRARS